MHIIGDGMHDIFMFIILDDFIIKKFPSDILLLQGIFFYAFSVRLVATGREGLVESLYFAALSFSF